MTNDGFIRFYNVNHPFPGAPLKAGTLVTKVPEEGGYIDVSTIHPEPTATPEQRNAYARVVRKRVHRIVDFSDGKLALEQPEENVTSQALGAAAQARKELEETKKELEELRKKLGEESSDNDGDSEKSSKKASSKKKGDDK